jgi:hypothetical protein
MSIKAAKGMALFATLILVMIAIMESDASARLGGGGLSAAGGRAAIHVRPRPIPVLCRASRRRPPIHSHTGSRVEGS